MLSMAKFKFFLKQLQKADITNEISISLVNDIESSLMGTSGAPI